MGTLVDDAERHTGSHPVQSSYHDAPPPGGATTQAMICQSLLMTPRFACKIVVAPSISHNPVRPVSWRQRMSALPSSLTSAVSTTCQAGMTTPRFAVPVVEAPFMNQRVVSPLS